MNLSPFALLYTASKLDHEVYTSDPLKSPITTLTQHNRQFLQCFLVRIIKSIILRTISIYNCNRLNKRKSASPRTKQKPKKGRKRTHLPSNNNRNHNLALTLRVTSNMPGKSTHIPNKHSPLLRCSGPAYTTPIGDGLAGWFPLERAQEKG